MFIGIMILYLVHPSPKVVNNYPVVDSLSNIVYKDNLGKCYSYMKEKRQC
tara:strand:- start:692 stop:841 length:150 start_codon:yes stop_codon:yes gene_type:complete